MIRAIESIETESPSTFILDIIAAVHNRNIIDSEEKFKLISNKRNTIAHEYMLKQDEQLVLFKFVVDHTTMQSNATTKSINYAEQYL